jgi:hypothetical protein
MSDGAGLTPTGRADGRGVRPQLVFLGPPSTWRRLWSGDVRRRSSGWPALVLSAWDRQCAFCGYDGQLGNAAVGIEAAHVRWFNFDGPDDLDHGLAPCALDHQLLDRGVLGMTTT